MATKARGRERGADCALRVDGPALPWRAAEGTGRELLPGLALDRPRAASSCWRLTIRWIWAGCSLLCTCGPWSPPGHPGHVHCRGGCGQISSLQPILPQRMQREPRSGLILPVSRGPELRRPRDGAGGLAGVRALPRPPPLGPAPRPRPFPGPRSRVIVAAKARCSRSPRTICMDRDSTFAICMYASNTC